MGEENSLVLFLLHPLGLLIVSVGVGDFTSISFLQIRLKALKLASVVPVMVTILSGQDSYEILIRAPDCKKKENKLIL